MVTFLPPTPLVSNTLFSLPRLGVLCFPSRSTVQPSPLHCPLGRPLRHTFVAPCPLPAAWGQQGRPAGDGRGKGAWVQATYPHPQLPPWESGCDLQENVRAPVGQPSCYCSHTPWLSGTTLSLHLLTCTDGNNPPSVTSPMVLHYPCGFLMPYLHLSK